MPYLIDGHNLIPKIPGFSLDEVDDEAHLIALLQDYCRIQRKQVEVFFDNSPSSQPKIQRFGNVVARFIRQGQSADQAIRNRLASLSRNARNWQVVSSDLAVQTAARAARARFISSDTFAAEILLALHSPSASPEKDTDPQLNPDEINDWLRLFKSQKK